MLDTAVFKKLAHNDTAAAAGHQGGIVIPKEIAPFFPPLPGDTSPSNPTVDRRLRADMFVDGDWVGQADTRYQHQTWGGKRPAERRLTDNLGPIRNVAQAGDICLFVKDLTDDDRLQIHLLTRGTPEHARIDSLTGARRWGPADPAAPPVTVGETAEAEAYVADQAAKPGAIFRETSEASETRTVRLARDRAFRLRVLGEYGFRCAFTGRAFADPSGGCGIDAAHIIPVKRLGSDHPVNGIPLAKDVHWAFDRGLLGVDANRAVVTPAAVAALPGNAFLAGLNGRPILEAATSGLRASDAAFGWHREHVLTG